MSGKKKLCVDAQMITEDKSFKNDFTYSFKIEKNYFNVVQLNNDKFDMRIDNRSFDILVQEERSGKLRSDGENESNKISKKSSFDTGLDDRFSKFEPVPGNLRSNSRISNTNMNPRNSQDNFFNDQDFDFNGGGGNNLNTNFNKRGSMAGFSTINRKTSLQTPEDKNLNSYNDFNEFNNKFSTGFRQSLPGQRSNTNPTSTSGVPITSKAGNGLLVDVNEIYSDSRKTTVTDNKEILKNLNFDTSIREDVFLQNQKALQNFDVNNLTSEENWNDNNNQNNLNNQNNDNYQYIPSNLKNINTNTGRMSQISNQNTFDFTKGNMNMQRQNDFSNVFSSNINRSLNENSNIGSNMMNMNISQNMNTQNFLNNDVKNNITSQTSSHTFAGMGSVTNQNSGVPNSSISGAQDMNDFKVKLINFKKKIMGSGLVNIDNLLDDNKKQTNVSNNTATYNFNFSSGGMPINYINETQYKK